MEYYPAMKKEWSVAVCDNMNGPRGYYAERKVRKILYDFTYMCNLKNKTNEPTEQNRSHR